MLRFVDPGGRIYGAVGASNANLLAYWTAVNANFSSWSIVSSGGRISGTCLRNGPRYLNGNSLVKYLDSRATWGIALAFKVNSLPSGTLTGAVLGIYDTGTIQVDLRYDSSGILYITRNGTTIGSPSTSPITINAWYHIEVKVTIHPSAGTIECRLNGTTVIGPTSSINTRNSANSTANQIAIGNVLTSNSYDGANADFDDIIVWDTQTTDAQGNADIHDFIGDCGAYWLLPSGAGSSTQFTPDSGLNYARVADTTIDTTSYVESSTVNNLDLYALTDAPASVSTVKSLQVIDYGRKTDTGNRGAKAVLRTGGTNYPHTNEMALSDSYIYFASGWGTNPNTGVAWTVSDINGLETGPKVTT